MGMSFFATTSRSLFSSMIQPLTCCPAFTPSTTTTPTPSPSSCTTKWIMRYLRRRKAYSIRMLDRRRFLQALAALGLLAGARAGAQVNAKPRFSANPFSLGIASGYPQPAGFVLWTRLAPVPLAPGGGMAPEVIAVGWEVARDERMKQ